jgi:hypothetical protein
VTVTVSAAAAAAAAGIVPHRRLVLVLVELLLLRPIALLLQDQDCTLRDKRHAIMRTKSRKTIAMAEEDIKDPNRYQIVL